MDQNGLVVALVCGQPRGSGHDGLSGRIADRLSEYISIMLYYSGAAVEAYDGVTRISDPERAAKPAPILRWVREDEVNDEGALRPESHASAGNV